MRTAKTRTWESRRLSPHFTPSLLEESLLAPVASSSISLSRVFSIFSHYAAALPAFHPGTSTSLSKTEHGVRRYLIKILLYGDTNMAAMTSSANTP